MKKLIFILLFVGAAHAQSIDPTTQIIWPRATGFGAPTINCASTNYGQPYTDITNNNQYVCSASGWVELASNSGLSQYVKTNPTGTQTVAQPSATNFNVTTSGGGKEEYNGSEVCSAVNGLCLVPITAGTENIGSTTNWFNNLFIGAGSSYYTEISGYGSQTGNVTLTAPPVATGGDTLVAIAATQTLTNKSIAGSEINSSTVGSGYGGTGQAWSSSSGIPELNAGTFSLYNTSCSGATNALTWNSSTESFGCNTISAGTGTVTDGSGVTTASIIPVSTTTAHVLNYTPTSTYNLLAPTLTASDTVVTLSLAQTLTNKSIAGSEINSSSVGTTYGGTGQNWGSSSGIPQFNAGTASLYNTSCSGATNALTWNSSTEAFGCNTISAGTGTVTDGSGVTTAGIIPVSTTTAHTLGYTPTSTYNLSVPTLSANDTVDTLGAAQTFTGAKTFSTTAPIFSVGLISSTAGTGNIGSTTKWFNNLFFSAGATYYTEISGYGSQTGNVTYTMPPVATGSDTLVSIAATQSLSNKTLASPTFTGTVSGAGTIPLSVLAVASSTNTVVGAATSTTHTDLSMPSCSTSSSALQWTSGTGFACNSAIAASTATTATNATNIGITGNNTTNSTFYIDFVNSSDTTGNYAAQNAAGLFFNPSTSVLTANGGIGKTVHPFMFADMTNTVYTASQAVVDAISPVAQTMAFGQSSSNTSQTVNGVACTSQAHLITAATASTVFTIKDTTTSTTVGTITFAASGTTGTLSLTGTSISVGDLLTITAPATADSTAGGLYASICSEY